MWSAKAQLSRTTCLLIASRLSPIACLSRDSRHSALCRSMTTRRGERSHSWVNLESCIAPAPPRGQVRPDDGARV
jgi:hypothetical protein